MILCAAMDAYALLVMHRKRTGSSFRYGVLLYAISPFVARYTTSIVKDAMYSHAVLFLVAALAVCFLRNNGIIVVGATAAVYFAGWVFGRRDKENFLILCSIVIPLCIYSLFSNVIIPGLGIHKYATSEILSLPFQQTARFVSSREEQVTEEEKQIIDAVLDYEYIKIHYDPRLSDPVKATYRGDEDALKVYLKYWAGELTEHPVV